MKTIKRVLLAVGILLAIGIGSLAAMINLVDPNDYKPELVGLIEENTGRVLDFPGELEISFYPWFGFRTGALSIQDAPGFGDEPMLSIASANVQLKLLPLSAVTTVASASLCLTCAQHLPTTSATT